MKSVTVFVLAVVLLAVDCAKHSRKSKDHHEEYTDDNDVEWPHPDTVNNFRIPDIFTTGSFSLNYSRPGAEGDSKSSTSGKHHGRANKLRSQ